MICRGFLVACAVLVLASPARAARTTLVPGVTYSHTVQYTRTGPVSMHVVTAPRPGGLYALQPVLSNDAITGRERVSSMQKRLAPRATAVGVNGDFFNWSTGVPTGILVQGGVLQHHPHPGRSSAGVDASGALHVDRVSLTGFWRAAGAVAHPVNGVNERPRDNQLTLYTPAWGASTPPEPGSTEIVLTPFPPLHAGTDLVGPVATAGLGGGTAIPRDGAVLVARGAAASALQSETPIGTQVTVRLALRPAAWSEVVEAVGGGPVVVRNGSPVYRSLEQLTPTQLFGREPRSAVGQRADGSIVLVAVDGRRPWYSVGITNYELGQALVRLGCVTASALDSGGSVTMAFDGKVLNRPSDSYGERPVAEALLVTYAGVYAPTPPPVVSPNGDGVADTQRLAYKVVRPSTVTARLVGPGGVTRDVDLGAKEPGTYTFAWAGRAPDGTAEPEGRWRWDVSSTDDLGRASTIARPFALNTTLGFPSLSARRLRSGSVLGVSFVLARPATVRVTIETAAHEILRTIASGNRDAGRVGVRWNGRDGRRKRLARGSYVVHIASTNELGTSDVRIPFRVG